MSYAGLGLPLAATHIDHPYSQQEQPQNASVYKWRLVLSYDGTRFAGWQYQRAPPTLQCILEQALTRVTKVEREELCLVGASRTDKGVHALGQVAHFFTPFNYDGLQDMHAALNGILPPDVRVREISSAVPEFHARFSVTGKIYRYNIYNDTVLDPFHRLYAFHNLSKLNICAMKEGAKYLVGKHDFSSFANTQRNDRKINPVKNISRVDIIEKVIANDVKFFQASNSFLCSRLVKVSLAGSWNF